MTPIAIINTKELSKQLWEKIIQVFQSVYGYEKPNLFTSHSKSIKIFI